MTRASCQICIIKKEKGQKLYWLNQDYLIETIPELTEEYLRTKARYRYAISVPTDLQKDIMPDSGKSWRYAKIKGQFYYDYDRIPDTDPTRYRSSLPAKDDILNDNHEKPLTSVYKLIEGALKSGYKALIGEYTGDSRQSLARAAAVLDVISKYVENNLINPKSLAFWQEVSLVVNHKDIKYLPKNARRLKEKYEALASGNHLTEVIKLPRSQNLNALKYEDDEMLSWVVQMRGMGTNYTNTFITRSIVKMCLLTGKKVPSESWFLAYLSTHQIKWITAPGRFGSRNKNGYLYKGYVPMANALFAGDCWQADGTRVNFIPYHTPDGDEMSLYMIVIRDVHSGDVLGVHFDTKENRWGYINALKMAVANTGYLPYELVIDRFPGHNTPEWQLVESRIEEMGTKVSKAHTATGKAKLERWFSTLQLVFMQSSKYYYGEGVQSKHAFAHRSAEYLVAAKKQAKAEGWDFDNAWKEAWRIIEAYRNTKLSDYSRKFAEVAESPIELHNTSPKPHVSSVDLIEQVFLFGLEKEVQIKSNGLITTDIMKISYVYAIDDLEVIQHHRKVKMNYDLADLGKVYLYTPKGEYLCEATEQRAIVLHGPEAEYKALSKVKQRMAKIEKHRADVLAELVGEGNEVDMLLGGLNSKGAVESAENSWLADRTKDWVDHGSPRIVNNKVKDILPQPMDEDDDIYDIRQMY